MAEAPDLTYYPARQLDIYPTLSTALDLDDPDTASPGLPGHALLRVLINMSGGVDHISVVEAEPPGYFEAAAKRAFMSARFTPALRNGRPVRSQVLVRIDYYSRERAPPK